MGDFRKKIKVASREPMLDYADFNLRIGRGIGDLHKIDVNTRFSEHVPLAIPIAGAAMEFDEHAMAIALAMAGGIGVIHRNNTPEQQLEEVQQVKKHEAFVIRDAKTITPDKTVAEAQEVMKRHENGHMSNLSLPVIESVSRKVVGMLTERDVDAVDDPKQTTVEQAMTKGDKLVTARYDISEKEAYDMMRHARVKKLLLLDQQGLYYGLVVKKDVLSRLHNPQAIRDSEGRLRVAAAIGSRDVRRVKLLDPWVDAFVVDQASFYTEADPSEVVKLFEHTKKDIVIGNFGTKEGVLDCMRIVDRAAGVKGGIGGGAACSTQETTGVGVPATEAVLRIREAFKEVGRSVPVGGDGGVKIGRNIAQLLAMGADYAMCGYVFAGTTESAAPRAEGGGKEYRGMGSAGARQKRVELGIGDTRYPDRNGNGLVEGQTVRVERSGSASEVIEDLVRATKKSMDYTGARNIEDMHRKVGIELVRTRTQKPWQEQALMRRG